MSEPHVTLGSAEFFANAKSATVTLHVSDCPDLQALHCLTQSWLAGAVVAQDHAEPSVAEQPRDSGQRSPAADQLGRQGVTEGVGVQAGLAETTSPASEDLRDAIRRELAARVDDAAADVVIAGLDGFDNEAWMDKTAQAICRLFAERQNAAPSLAADLQLARARVEVLEAEARDLAAAKASAEDKFEQIRVALGATDVAYFLGIDWLSNGPRAMANALNQIERLLPPEHVGRSVPSSGQRDASERVDAAPAVFDRATEDARKEA